MFKEMATRRSLCLELVQTAQSLHEGPSPLGGVVGLCRGARRGPLSLFPWGRLGLATPPLGSGVWTRVGRALGLLGRARRGGAPPPVGPIPLGAPVVAPQAPPLRSGVPPGRALK